MLSLAHTIISLPLGLYLQNPIIIFLVAFILHFILDSITHWNIDPTKYKHYPILPVLIDVLGGLLIAWLITKHQFFTIPVLAAIAGSNMPDILHSLWLLVHKPTTPLTPLFNWHHNIQRETDNIPRGLVWQILLIIVASAAVLLFPTA